MCGIAGIFHPDRAPVDRERLQRMINVLVHRGPDGEGLWINTTDTGAIGLAHRRLSILDLTEAARQPMHYRSRYVLTFNGEIYNYIELRKELEKKGHRFETESDTEVIPAAYAQYGSRCVEYFDGMFAFALWDREERILFCARDRFGEKPFYYHYEPGRELIFASEMKALFAGGIDRGISHDMLYRYLAFDVVEDPLHPERTFYGAVKSLPAAHSLTLMPGGEMKIKRYWSVNEKGASFSGSEEEAIECFTSLFRNSVARRLRSDVPVGSSLSGGLDSSSVVAAVRASLSAAGKASLQTTFSARFDDPALDEGPYMKMMESHFGLRAFYTCPGSRSLRSELDRIFYHQEEPFGSASILAQWEVMKLARDKEVTVLLDGQGADEILGGYHKYFEAFLRELWINDRSAYLREAEALASRHDFRLRRGLRWWLNIYLPSGLKYMRHVAGRLRKAEWQKVFHPDFLAGITREEPPFRSFQTLNDTLKYDVTSYGLGKLLRFSDRNAMAFSREVRLPFLSHELADFVFTLPPRMKIREGWTKYLLRKAMEEELPRAITWRVDKKGFAPPQKKWLEDPELQRMIADARELLLREKYIRTQGHISDWQLLMAFKLLRCEFPKS